ncbi:response regulator [Halomonas sp. DQ26W]|uniref:response regulator n=1 Tax=Halomonas sp. DQ26W TaxID=2282311 RepID=UPI0015F0B2AC|nr:response regulator [Halomonas sp. DQ26W]
MSPATSKDRLWSHLVWPLLWPLLLAQLLLVLLCLAVGLILWLATPDPTSWAASGWLLLTLLVGTTLTTAAFLLQLRHRLRECEAQVEDGLTRVERLLLAADQILPRWIVPPARPVASDDAPGERLEKLQASVAQLHTRLSQLPDLAGMLMSVTRPALLLYRGRIVGTNLALERLLGESAEALEGESHDNWLRSTPERYDKPGEVQVLDAEKRWRQLDVERFESRDHQLLLFGDPHDRLPQLGGLVAARERAREDSRLKSRYLTLLQRELDPLLSGLAEEMKNAECDLVPGQLPELCERLADVALLVKSLAGDGVGQESPDGFLASAAALPLRILIVDDGPVNRMLASQVLEGQGFEVDCVAGGHEALEQRHGQAYDLVLMDIYMPDMDGIEAARRWRELEAGDPEGSYSVLVALTANANEEDRRRFREAGMDDYLAKPYGPRALIDMLRYWRPDAFGEATTQ